MIRILIIPIHLLISLTTFVFIILSITWSKLPNLDAMTNYKPPIPLRIYSADHILIGEFGEERRKLLKFHEIPDQMKMAILATEDDRFYQHKGIDWQGILRAGIVNLKNMSKSQGASTITMQVARNFYLSTEKTYLRKVYELLLTIKIESELTKNQILELYMNQIYLGHHTYGFEAASLKYLNKSLSEINIAEAALLAGIPKAPSIYNPISNFSRAKTRQKYILDRMLSLEYISKSEYIDALNKKIIIKTINKQSENYNSHGEYVAEIVRQLLFKVYKNKLYSKGINVYTTIKAKDQEAAYQAIRSAVIKYTLQSEYNGPEEKIKVPVKLEDKLTFHDENIHKILDQLYDSDELKAYLVINIDENEVTLINKNKKLIKLNDKKSINLTRIKDQTKLITVGSIVYVYEKNNIKQITNLPSVQAAFVSISPQNGAILSLIGGFDFNIGNFNRVIQAWRQPGSSIKPFIYAASLEKGVSPNTKVSDLPFSLTAEKTGSKPWNPKNYGHRYEENLTMRQGLYKSKNMISIRILDNIGPIYAQEYLTKFGFDKSKHPAVLSMALGTGLVTPLQLTTAFSVFANGGHLIPPYLIERVTDSNGEILMQHSDVELNDTNQTIDSRVSYIMNNLLKGVATYGTASKAKKALNRSDVAGKTGTTNESFDAWFSGYTPEIVATAWLGFDLPKSLGQYETGGRLAMPIWIDYMKKIIKNLPEHKESNPPEGIIIENNDYYLKEFPPGKTISEICTHIPDNLINTNKKTIKLLQSNNNISSDYTRT
ncbi:penicillin-binding protein 1A [Candidatus Kinetoplastibacterium desouzaii TCC079E]|uniref:peptidoglycan glycosyltransferase n=2 Tax=Candidatus Kinetoplastidibacterium desouzai TaxID=994692 RepID=M1LT47_9PROT|nr:penicillin-binding protein 1A [Candidatus Kinetoplastibacterium desouzaii TCC079E]